MTPIIPIIIGILIVGIAVRRIFKAGMNDETRGVRVGGQPSRNLSRQAEARCPRAPSGSHQWPDERGQSLAILRGRSAPSHRNSQA